MTPSLALAADISTAEPAERCAERAPAPWGRAFEDVQRQHGFERLRVEGYIPDDLAGTVYRNGPGLLSCAGERYDQWSDGDGAVSAVRMERGKAAGAVRVVESPGLLEERSRGRRLFSGFATRSPRLLREHWLGRTKNRANVSVLWWCGRLFALGGGVPIELSPDDLATRGEVDPEDLGLGALSPHVRHLDSRRATFAACVVPGRRPRLDVFKLPYEGVAERLAGIGLRATAPVHDFAATARHLVFCIPPLRTRSTRLAFGLGALSQNLVWDASEGTEIIVVPIDDPGQPVRFLVDAFLPLHTCNAFEREGELVLDVVGCPDPENVLRYHASLPGGRVQGALDSSLTRISLDLRRRSGRAEMRLQRSCDLPRVAPHAEGEPYRRAWMVGHSSTAAARTSPPDRLLAVDVETGSCSALELGPDQFVSEPVPVQKARSVDGRDVWLLVDVHDARTHTTHLAILDGAALDAGPVARIHFDHHVPPSFHGSWCPRPG